MKKIILFITVMSVMLALCLPASAETASVSILQPLSQTEIHEGEPLSISASLQNRGATYKVRFYVDECVVKSFSAEETPKCDVVGLNSGTHNIRVTAENVSGEELSQDSVTVSVEQNHAPEIAVNRLDEENPIIDLSAEQAVEVSISDAEENFLEAEVYLNGVLTQHFTEEQFSADLSQSAAGDNLIEIKAVDSYGNKSGYSKKYFAHRTIETVLLTNDFEKYTGGAPSGFLNFVTTKGGSYSKVETDDAQNGTSMAIKVEQLATQNDVDPNIYYELLDRKIKYIAEASFYFPGNDENNYDATATIRCRNSDGSELKVIEFSKDGNLKLLGSGGELDASASEGSIGFELKKWYNIMLVIDGDSKKYDFYLDGKKLAAERTAENSRGEGITAFRFAICNNTQHSAEHSYSDIGAQMYIDNIKIASLVESPYIEKITTEGDVSVTPGASTFTATLSCGINENNPEKLLSVESEFGKLPIEAVSYDSENKLLNIVTGAQIQPNANYTLKIDKGMKISDTVKTDSPLQIMFSAEPGEVDIGDYGFSFVSGKLEFNADIKNKTSDDKEMLAVMYIWQGNEIVSAYTQTVSAAANLTALTAITARPIVKGEWAEVFVIELPTFERAMTFKKLNFSM